MLAVVVVVAVAVVGLAFIAGGTSSLCGGTGCGSSPQPSIQSAVAQVDAFSPSPCQATSDVATCSVFLGGGDHGTVSLNVSASGSAGGQGAPQVEFLVYSSASDYVRFTSMPICAHASAPSYQDSGCQVAAGSVHTFAFTFSVSQNYGDATARWPDSISIVMWMNAPPA